MCKVCRSLNYKTLRAMMSPERLERNSERTKDILEEIGGDMTEIKKCTCMHAGQDELHGVNNRVHNECNEGWRCTVCSRVTSVERE